MDVQNECVWRDMPLILISAARCERAMITIDPTSGYSNSHYIVTFLEPRYIDSNKRFSIGKLSISSLLTVANKKFQSAAVAVV